MTPCPISRLSNDLLLKIFRDTQSLAPDPLDSNLTSGASTWQEINWVVVTWVCREWRTLALDNSGLWTDVPTFFPQWTTAMLVRSGHADLTVVLRGSLRNGLGPALLAHRSRLVKLVACGDNFQRLHSRFQLFASAPKLKSLRIIKLQTGILPAWLTPNIQLPPTAFIDTASLRNLELSGVDFNWNSHLFSSSLDTLNLHEISRSKIPTAADFRSAMNKLTGLGQLLLRNVLPDEESIDTSALALTQISLPSLRSLAVEASPAGLLFFFSNITLSDQQNDVYLITQLEEGSRRWLVKLLAAMRRPDALGGFFSSALSVSIATSMADRYSKMPTFKITALGVFGSSVTNGFSEEKLAQLDFLIEDDNVVRTRRAVQERFCTIFRDIFNAFDWSNLSELSFSDVEIVPRPSFGTTLATTFGALATIKMISVGLVCANPLIEAIQLSNSMNATAHIAFPALAVIIMTETSFGAGGGKRSVDGGKLYECLQLRKSKSARVQEFIFKGCSGLDEDGIKMFTTVVDVVVWNNTRY